ncbi:MAG: carbohydrate-binding domain-containing protein, partial [Eggerthellaceae bacterium]|nr:carbohydrate-binding domain-containing protein [Eggerthellaceae bacterium]
NVTINRGSVSASTTSTDIFSWPINAHGHLTINGGTVSAQSNSHAILADGNVAINGGTVNATGGDDGYSGIYSNGTIEINGGNVTASSIYSNGTAITLGWTDYTDRITASSIRTSEGGTVAVADGKALTDGSGHIYTGTLTASELSGFAAETTLQPCLALADAASNTAAITDHAGQTLAVALSGRTLYKDGSWNTLCLPFDVTALQGSPLEGATVMELDTDGYYDGNTRYTTPADGRRQTGLDTASGTLYLYFQPAESIVAGRPYIVKWDADGTDIESPVFSGVTIDNSSEAQASNTVTAQNSGLNTVQFIGSHSPVALTPADKSNLFLGLANTLYYPDAANNDDGLYHVNSCRAYFHVDLAGAPNAVRTFVLSFGDDEQTGIAELPFGTNVANGANGEHWYTLDGRRLSGKPTAPGLYIVNGRKVIIK